MSASPTSKPKTVADLIELEAETERRYEIVDGEFVEVLTSLRTSETSIAFGAYLFGYSREAREIRTFDGSLPYQLPGSVRHARVSLIRSHRLRVGEADLITGAPDVVVEVVSPTDRYSSVRRKVQGWLDARAQLVWLANPEIGEVSVYRRGQPVRTLTVDEILDGEDVLPGFSLEITRLFPPGS